MYGIRIPQTALERILANLERRGADTVAVCAAGVYREPEIEWLELLHHSTTFVRGDIRFALREILKQDLFPLLVISRRSSDARMDNYVEILRRLVTVPAGILAFFGWNETVRIRGCLIEGSLPRRVDHLSVPGARMLRYRVEAHDGPGGSGRRDESKQFREADEPAGERQTALSKETLFEGRYSRLAGALGRGNVATGYRYLERARMLKVAVLGTGRLGSLTALRLAQSGVGAEGGLILADGDAVEESNLDAMLLPPQAVGTPKSIAVARMIRGLFPFVRVLPIVGTLSDCKVARALTAADVVFTAVDEEYARLGAALLARRYHLVHIDIAGGLAYTGRGRVLTGGEVRMSVPGSLGCVGCFGRYRWDEIERLLSLDSEEEKERRSGTQWIEQRPGSWGDVLLPVVGESQQLFWQLVRGDIGRSVWLHYEHRDSGLPVWRDWTPSQARMSRCPLCSGQQGWGDLREEGGL